MTTTSFISPKRSVSLKAYRDQINESYIVPVSTLTEDYEVPVDGDMDQTDVDYFDMDADENISTIVDNMSDEEVSFWNNEFDEIEAGQELDAMADESLEDIGMHGDDAEIADDNPYVYSADEAEYDEDDYDYDEDGYDEEYEDSYEDYTGDDDEE